MTNLGIYITGLCAFVPKYDLRKKPKNNQMRLLLVESIKPADLPAHAHHAHEPHVPIFLCSCKNVAPDSERQPDMVFGRTAVFYLDDQDLRIKNASADCLEMDLGVEGGSGCPEGNEHSFEWVASLDLASPGSGEIRDSCLSPFDVDSSVIARAELCEGKISTDQLACDSDGLVVLWEYKPPYSSKKGQHYQAATDVVRFDVAVEDTVELVTSLLRARLSNMRVAEAFGRNKELSIKLCTDGSDIIAWIKNMPWADVLGTREPQRYDREPDIHFGHFYKLAAKYQAANVPHARGRCHAPVPHSGNPNCQPARTAPNSNA